jgi:uncharacterized protein (TIGR00266 family)
MKPWFYVDSERQRHQVTEEQLQVLVSSGTLKPDSLVWCEGMPSWIPAKEALGHLFTAVSAPSLPPSLPGGLPPPMPMRSHDVDYEILGNEMQIVEVELDPNETVIAEAGGMNYMDDGIQFETRMGDGSAASGAGFMGLLKNIGKRVLTGESLFMTHFTNRGAGKKRVAFAAPYPGKIVPLKLTDYGGEILCEKDAFLCAAFGTEVGIAFQKKFGAGLFGGEGFILQRLRGDGMAFIHAGGHIVKKELRGETIRVDTGCLVAFTSGISYDIERAGNLKSMFFGGEGLFLTTLRGHGTVWLQSLPFSRLADRILANAPSAGGAATGEGSVLGGLGIGNLFGGD